jgi:CheY-like chemotaxis protein
MLEKSGWKVVEAEDGHVALEQISKDRPAVILLDLSMPEMAGFEFVNDLYRQSEWRSIPIVVLTDKDLTAAELKRLNGSIYAVLDKGQKPRQELMHEVRDLIARWSTPVAMPL